MGDGLTADWTKPAKPLVKVVMAVAVCDLFDTTTDKIASPSTATINVLTNAPKSLKRVILCFECLTD
jgi:hypothetical protein